MPCHVLIGSDELIETDIYSIVQDDEGIIWLTTDRGLLRYDGYDFKSYAQSEQGTHSLFGLVKGQSGDLYCFNMAGNIFRIRDDSLAVYQKIPDSLLLSSMVIATGPEDHLWVSCRQVIEFDTSGSIKVLPLKSRRSYGKDLVWNHDKELYVSVIQNLEIDHYKGQTYSTIYRPAGISNQLATRKHFVNFKVGEMVYSRINGTFQCFEISGAQLKPVFLDISNVVGKPFVRNVNVTQEGQFWFTLLDGGLYVFAEDGKPMYGGQKIFADHLVSGFLEDAENNLWLTTLGDGILFIPNKNALSFAELSGLRGERVNRIAVGNDGDIFLSSRKRNIFRLDEQRDLHKLPIQTDLPVTFLSFLKYHQKLAYNSIYDGILLDINTMKTQDALISGAVKSMQEIGRSLMMVVSANRIGFLSMDETKIPDDIHQLKGMAESEGGLFSFSHDSRIYCAYYDEKVAKLWIGTAKGVFMLDPDTIHELKWKGESVFGTSFYPDGDAFLVCTSNSGLLKVEGGKVIWQMDEESGLNSNFVSQVARQGDRLFIRHREGMQIYDMQKKSFRDIGLKDGFSSSVFSDFALRGNELWVIANGSVQMLDISTLKKNTIAPEIRLTGLKVSHKERSYDASAGFDYSHRQFEFEFKGVAYRHMGLMRYRYMLEGNENEWQESGFEQNRVRYSGLEPGTYRFRVKAVNEDGLEGKEAEYQFSISAPFWRTWPFFALALLFVVSILTAYFRFLIRGIKKGNAARAEQDRIEKELVASRLSALTAQMNPHFLFNTLNSIQEYIVTNERKLARKYLGKFADLMRIYLSHSRSQKVSVREEMEALEAYLVLEKLRFEDSLEYEIRVNDDLEVDLVDIPSMLIQPFVENALTHGLLHKEKNRKLSVNFQKAGFEGGIVCVVEDNGIGRAKAQEIREMRNPKHVSIATSTAHNRLHLLNYGRQVPIGLEIKDLVDADGRAGGTRVILTIPAM